MTAWIATQEQNWPKLISESLICMGIKSEPDHQMKTNKVLLLAHYIPFYRPKAFFSNCFFFLTIPK